MIKYFIFICFILLGCNKVKVSTSEVISAFSISNKSLMADGKSLDTLSVNLNVNADITERGVLFTSSGGMFLNGSNMTYVGQAYYLGSLLTANAYFIAPFQPGIFYFTVTPASTSYNFIGNYTLTDTLYVLRSVADSIQLQTSSFGIDTNYQSSITLKGVLKNAQGNPVSVGTGVKFESYLPDGRAVNGQFGLINTQSDSSSSVNASYSIGSVIVGSTFFIKTTVLDSLGQKTNIKDSILITVTQ